MSLVDGPLRLQLMAKAAQARRDLVSRSPIVSFHALGKPATKGSWKIRRKRGKAFLQADNDREKPWALMVGWAAKEAMAGRPLIDRGVKVSILFDFVRPKNPAREFPTGDVDKLARSTLDALTGTVWTDDVLVVSMDVTKRYVAKDPGAHIYVYELGGRV
jgi:Holliday junction resolvase RusA-like endonuclease